MAALSETDRRKILGDDYLEMEKQAQRRSGMGDAQISAKMRIDRLEAQKFTAFAMVLIGLALLGTAYFSMTGKALVIEDSIAGGMTVLGIAWMIFAASRIGQLRRVMTSAA